MKEDTSVSELAKQSNHVDSVAFVRKFCGSGFLNKYVNSLDNSLAPITSLSFYFHRSSVNYVCNGNPFSINPVSVFQD
jgi:hypothetical protein